MINKCDIWNDFNLLNIKGGLITLFTIPKDPPVDDQKRLNVIKVKNFAEWKV